MCGYRFSLTRILQYSRIYIYAYKFREDIYQECCCGLELPMRSILIATYEVIAKL